MECVFCNGGGLVDATTGDGEEHQWGCPDCNGTGKVEFEVMLLQNDCIAAAQSEILQFGGSPK